MPRVARLTTETMEVATRRSSRARAVVNYASQMAVKGHENPIDPALESPLTDFEPEGSPEPPPPKKRRRKAKILEPVVYDIPPVEMKTSAFRGKNGAKFHA